MNYTFIRKKDDNGKTQGMHSNDIIHFRVPRVTKRLRRATPFSADSIQQQQHAYRFTIYQSI